MASVALRGLSMWRESVAWRNVRDLACNRDLDLEGYLCCAPPVWLPASEPYWRSVAVAAGIDPQAWDEAWAAAHAVSEACLASCR